MPEIIFTNTGNEAEDRQIRRTATAGTLRQIVPRIYTSNLHDSLDAVVRRNIWEILGKLFPGAVVSARSALLSKPAYTLDDAGREKGPGYIFLTGRSRRSIKLPGVEVRVASGVGPLPGDVPFLGLYLASPARHLLENLSPTRERSGMARGLPRDEVERYLVRQCDIAGEARLSEIRDQARSLAKSLNADKAFQELDNLIGGLLNSREARLRTPAGLALAAGEPIDISCVERLNTLFSYLRQTALPRREDRGKGTPAATAAAFIEAYFSNYIEGTRFLVGEARSIVFDGVIPESRPKDGHDVLATFRQVTAVEDMRREMGTFEEFETMLKARHHALMEARPDVSPGEFKSTPNQAGNTIFVQPGFVRGTLRNGLGLLAGLDEPFARAVFIHFLIADVHPFADGNGRISRIMMTAELVRAGLARVIIPTVYREDYLGGMRALTRHGDPSAIVRCLDRAQDIGSAIVEDDVEQAIVAWAKTYAFAEGGAHARFAPYDESRLIEWRDGVPAPRDYWEGMAARSNLPL